ncbi:MAG: hypothetical protein RAO94_06580 [Candidatus Stygibacter australis]|nr:hypothetical protein [Candidatus Stygibacter australis]MDP8321997.1 hypothetical protein [Candidatus Stygibacter australis]
MTTCKFGLIGFFLCLISFAYACTVISVANDSIVLAGGNKDWNNIATRIKVIPSKESKYGTIYFGYQVSQGFQNACGINEKGLWYEGASLPERFDIYNVYNKPEIKGELCEKALAECTNVNEVIDLYSTYFTRHWNGHSMWADTNGNSVIIEYGENDVVFLEKEEEFQVMTNFYLCNSNSQWDNCYRYQIAQYLFTNTKNPSIELMKEILEATHQTGCTPTLFSTVCDLINLKVYVFNFHNYEETVIIDVAEKLNKGENYYELPSLFCQLQLTSPEKNSVISSQEVTFSWKGNSDYYILQYSLDEFFADYQSIVVNDTENVFPIKKKLPFLSGMILLAGFTSKRKPIFFLLLLIIIAGMLFNCSYDIINSPYPESDREFNTSVNNLHNNSMYFWKIVAVGENGMISESEVRNFYHW